jgi:hypothetical protein
MPISLSYTRSSLEYDVKQYMSHMLKAPEQIRKNGVGLPLDWGVTLEAFLVVSVVVFLGFSRAFQEP